MSDNVDGEVVAGTDAMANEGGAPAEVPEAAPPPPQPDPVAVMTERLARLEGQLAASQQQTQYLAAIAARGQQPQAAAEEPPEVDDNVRRYIAQRDAQSMQQMQALQKRLDEAEFRALTADLQLEQSDIDAAQARHQAWEADNIVLVDGRGQPYRPSVTDALRFHLGTKALKRSGGAASAPGGGTLARAPKTEPVVTERPGRAAIAPKAVDPSKIPDARDRLDKYWYQQLADVEF